jgi:hypothetical protein
MESLQKTRMYQSGTSGGLRVAGRVESLDNQGEVIDGQLLIQQRP